MIKFNDFLENRGYIRAAGRNVSYYKRFPSLDSSISISRRNIEIYINLGVEFTNNIFFILKNGILKDYFTPYKIDSIYRSNQYLVLIKNITLNNSYISNTGAKKIEAFLEPFDNEENLQKISEDLKDIVSRAQKGDEDIKEVKDYKDIQTFIKNKGLEMNDRTQRIRKDFTTGSYKYELCISPLLHTYLQIKIILTDSTYFDELVKLYKPKDDNFIYTLNKIWYSTYFDKFTSLFPPFDTTIYFLDGTYMSIGNNAKIILSLPSYADWNNEERLEFIKEYINVFTDASSAKEFLDLIGELIIESIGNEL